MSNIAVAGTSAVSGFTFGTILGGLANSITGMVASAIGDTRIAHLPSNLRFGFGSMQGGVGVVKVLESEMLANFLNDSLGEGIVGTLLGNSYFFIESAKVATIATSVYWAAFAPFIEHEVQDVDKESVFCGHIAGATMAMGAYFFYDPITALCAGSIAAYAASTCRAHGMSRKTLAIGVGSALTTVASVNYMASGNDSSQFDWNDDDGI